MERERELQQWEASMLYGANKDNSNGADGGELRRSKEGERQRRLELMARIAKLQGRIVEIEQNGRPQSSTGKETHGDENREEGTGGARHKDLEKWAATLKRQQQSLDEEALCLANDLEALKAREERLYNASSAAVENSAFSDALQGSDSPAAADKSWGTALGFS